MLNRLRLLWVIPLAVLLGVSWNAEVASLRTDLTHLKASVALNLRHHSAVYLPTAQLPADLLLDVVAVEDSRFRQHHGIDWWRLGGALWADVKAGRVVEGGSTLTEQLVKNTVLLGQENGAAGKIQAMLLSRRVETLYPKDSILELYLNAIYFGRRAYGIRAAARTYFGALPSQLDPVQQSFLAGVIQGPALYDPERHCPAARRRMNEVLQARVRAGTLSGEEAARLSGQPLRTRNGACLVKAT